MQFVCSAAVPKRRVQWLWRPFIQRGAINLLTGGPGTGKSTITCDIAAALSRGDPLPGDDDETAKERGVIKTLMLNAEDDPEDTMVWRLDNQRADRSKIWLNVVSEAIASEQIQEIEDFVRSNDIGLIVVDPVQAWIGQDTDMYRPNHMRAWGNLFKNLCVKTGVTVLWVRHRRKGDADDHNNINSGLGSIDLSGIVRSEIGAIVTKAGSKITRIKGNVGRMNDTLHYSVEDTGDEGNDHGQLHWSVEVKQVAPAGPKKAAKKTDAAGNMLVSSLFEGPMAYKDLLLRAEHLGIARSTLDRAAKDLIVEVEIGGQRAWRLRTPADKHDESPNKPVG